MAPHTDPSSIRYLKARLRVLKKPAVWGSLSLVLLTLGTFAVYWKYSKILGKSSQAQSPASSPGSGRGVASLDGLPRTANDSPIPSQSDSAIGADIDTLPLLLNDFNNQSAPGALGDEPEGAESPSDRPSEEETAEEPRSRPVVSPRLTLISPSDRSTSSLDSSSGNSNSSFLNLDTPPINLLPGGSSASGSGLAQGSGFSRTSPLSGQPANATPVNALQSALDRNNASTASRSQPQSSFQLLPGQVSQPSLTNPSGQGFVQSAPTLQTSPPLGSTGYTIPSTLRLAPVNGAPSGGYGGGYGGYSNAGQQPGTASTQPYSNLTPRPLGSYQSPFQSAPSGGLNVPQSSGYTQPQGSGYQAPSNGSTVRQQPPPRFSYPGRPIGNGQIGTFGNPTAPRE